MTQPNQPSSTAHARIAIQTGSLSHRILEALATQGGMTLGDVHGRLGRAQDDVRERH